jgi:hypothetical protein
VLKNLLIVSLFCLTSTVQSSYNYQDNQSLIDLTGVSGTTSLAASDDGVSNAFALGFTFDYYGQEFTQARVATNGCLHFKTSGVFCSDFTPDPISGQHTYTMYPFWTDLIRDNGSSVLAKSYSDKTVFGWYDMKEYGRNNTNNSFEVILWGNDTFEYRYGALDIEKHDVLIGEIGGSNAEKYQYLFYDQCSTGSTNASNCVSENWNASSSNTLLENGGSLFSATIDCSDPLNNSSCSGYASAYLSQECGLTQLYSEECPDYWESYEDLQCDENPQYAPSCPSYRQEDSFAYFNEEEDYGYTEEDMWYDEEFDEWLDPNDPCYENRCEGYTDADWYELDTEQFGQEQVDEWFGTDIAFGDDGMVDFESTPMTSYEDLDVLMDVWDTEQEHYEIVTYDMLPMDATVMAHELIIIEELQHEEIEREELEAMEEIEEHFEEELAETEELIEEYQIAESIEEPPTEEEIRQEENREEPHEEEFFAEEGPQDEEKSSVRVSASSIVAGTIRTATNSVRTTRSTSTVNYSGSSNSYSSSGSSNSVASSSSGGVSTSSSPSRSDQFASSTAQTNQVLSMGGGSTGSVSVFVTPMPTVDDSPQVVMAEVQVQDMQGDIDTAVSGVMTASEADQVADKIIAQNIESQQDQAEQEQEETGEYGDQSALVAYLGYVPGFNSYKDAQIPNQQTWYEPRSIYANASIADNTQVFYELAGTSFNTLSEMINLQPNL